MDITFWDNLTIHVSPDDWDYLCINRFFSDNPAYDEIQAEFVTGTGITPNKKHLWKQICALLSIFRIYARYKEMDKTERKENKLKVYDRIICFLPEEERIMLELSGPFMELLLHWNGVEEFNTLLSDEECHSLCVNAIVSYTNTVTDALKCAEREGLI